jgi:hypothetical protein
VLDRLRTPPIARLIGASLAPCPEERVRSRSERRRQDGNRITSARVSAGIDMSLHLVERLTNAELSRLVQLVIEYDPEPPRGRIEWEHTDVLVLTGMYVQRLKGNLADRPDLVEHLID